ncbi:MAG: T9SS type A sorting domain-containing protein [Ignavibacteria bacterium]
MKPDKYKLVFLALLFLASNIFSQNGNIADYLPLQVGNVWIYQHSAFGAPPCYCSLKIRVKVTGTNVYNGKTYFQNQVSYQIISCPRPCITGFLPYDSLMRVDTASGKVLRYAPGAGCITANELMLDSLKAKKNDTIRVYCQPPLWYLTYVCSDTNNITFFGSSRQARVFSVLGFEGGWTRTYLKGIGLIRTNCYAVGCNGFTELLGCVLNGIVYGDTGFVVGLNQISSEIPSEFSLSQNYPNPFNPTTHIGFRIKEFGLVKLTIYDALGKEVAILVNIELQPGSYEADWDASAYPSSVYYYKLESGSFTETKKMVLIK